MEFFLLKNYPPVLLTIVGTLSVKLMPCAPQKGPYLDSYMNSKFELFSEIR